MPYAVHCGEIKLGRTFLSLNARVLEIILWSTFNKEIVYQFLINLYHYHYFFIFIFISLFYHYLFFSVRFMTTCLGEVLNSFLDFAVRHEFKKYLFYLPRKLQKTLLSVHRFQVIYYFTYSIGTCTILLQIAHCCIH